MVAEDDAGVTVSGMKMLATSAVYADEILIGNLTPIADKFKSEAITAALPLNAPGLSLWSRQPYAQAVAARGRLSAVLSLRRDRQRAGVRPREDSVGARVPAQRRRHVAAHLHRDAGELLPEPSFQHPLLVEDGADRRLASRITQANGIDKIPAVRETLGRLAALEATIGGLVQGQIEAFEEWPEGYATPNRRIMYASLNWCQEHHTEIVDMLRTLLGGIPLLMPASIDVMTDEALRDTFERWWKTPSIEAVDRYKLYKLAWDIVGSEFAGRHMLYEKFYAGNSLVVRNQSDREAPWETFHGIVDGLLHRIDVPTKPEG